MFGMGFTEILLIAVVAIIALGPEKLPNAMVDIAKFFRKFKSGIEDAKSTLDQELELEKLKQEADKYKSQLTEVQNTMNPHNLDRLIDDSFDPKPKVETTSEIQEAELVSSKSESNLAEHSSEQPKEHSSEQPKEQFSEKKEKKSKKEKVSFKDKKAKLKGEA